MPSREWLLRIHDIIAAAMENIQSTQSMTFEQFEMAESLFIKGILYNFIIIGEAAINVPEEIQTRYQKIPWQLMSDMKFAGMYADNPVFPEVLEHIEAYRGELDAEMEAYYRQLDNKC